MAGTHSGMTILLAFVVCNTAKSGVKVSLIYLNILRKLTEAKDRYFRFTRKVKKMTKYLVF